jgi:NitT/TauT family transport system substrate-binding protein
MTQLPQLWTRRHTLWMMGGMVGAMTLHACTPSAETTSTSPAASTAASPTEPVKAVNGSGLWIGYSPLYIAVEKGFFKAGGLDLETKVFSSTSEVDSAFASGRLESISSVTSEAVALAGNKQDFRIVQVADSSKGSDGILARNSVKDVADFKGKQIAVEIGSVSHFFLLQVLQEAGLTANDVQLINVTSDAAAAAYASGKVDIAVTYSPFLQQSNNTQKDGRIIYDSSKMPTAIVDIYVFSTKFVQAHPHAVQGFVNGIYKAQDFIQTNADEAYAIAGKQLQLKPEDLANQLKGVKLISPEENIKLMADPSSDIYLGKHLESLAKFLKGQNQLSDLLTLDQLSTLIDPTFVKAASV